VRVFVNDRLVEEHDAVVSVFDRGFLYGDGIFESMRVVAGTVFRLGRHLDRLTRSAALIDLRLDGLPDLRHAIGTLLQANRLRDARLRVTLTRGPGRPGEYVAASGPPTLVISGAPYAGPDPRLASAGVEVRIATRQAVPAQVLDPAVKSLSRLSSVLARREAAAHGAHEAILTDAADRLTEGTVSNLFVVREGRLRTPPSTGEALPGITREAILELAPTAGIESVEEPLSRSALLEADEAFLTNTSWEVLPIARVDGRPLGTGAPGPVARRLGALYRELLHRECGDA
jgi:branched-chain amino acid aminotransferase